MFEWFYQNDTLLWWLLALSISSMLFALIAVPIMLLKIPRDYFSFPYRHHVAWSKRNRLLRIPYFLLKNIIGAVLILTGALMLVLPGQGVLTIIIGLVVMEFPGKYRFELWLINRPVILDAINWIRVKAGKPKLVTLPKNDSNSSA